MENEEKTTSNKSLPSPEALLRQVISSTEIEAAFYKSRAAENRGRQRFGYSSDLPDPQTDEKLALIYQERIPQLKSVLSDIERAVFRTTHNIGSSVTDEQVDEMMNPGRKKSKSD